MTSEDVLSGKIISPIKTLLKQGLSPGRLALSFAIGAVIGVFPFIGTSSTLCVLVAWPLRLNQVAIQISNYLVYPLQFILLIPFVRMGESILGVEPISLDPSVLVDAMSADFFGGIGTYGKSLLHGCFAWSLVALPAIAILWAVIYGLLSIYSKKDKRLEM